MAKTTQGIILDDAGLYDKILYVSKSQLEMFEQRLQADSKAAVAKEEVIKLLEPEDPEAVLVPCDISGASKDFPGSPEAEEILAKLSPLAAVHDIIKAHAHFQTAKKNFKDKECPIEMTVGELSEALGEDEVPMEGEGGDEEGGEEEQPENSEEEDGEDEDEAGEASSSKAAASSEPVTKKAKTA